MYCNSCKKEVNESLVLFDGTLFCPFCKHEIVNNPQFVVTQSSDELFTLSEIIFYEAITHANQSKYAEEVKKAISLCEEAALLGHPAAYLKMGYYYDKDLAEPERTEEYRTKIAYEYYSAIAFCESASYDNEETFGKKYNFKTLRTTAANSLLTMLSNFTEGANTNEKYTCENALEKLERFNIDGLVVPNIVRKEVNQEINATRVFELLVKCLRIKRAPAYGYYTMKGAELVNLLDYADENMSLQNFASSGRYSFKYLIDGSRFLPLGTNYDFAYCKETLMKNPAFLEKDVHFAFFKDSLSTSRISKGLLKSAKSILFDDLKSRNIFGDFKQNKLLIYEDDIFFASSKNKFDFDKIRQHI